MWERQILADNSTSIPEKTGWSSQQFPEYQQTHNGLSYLVSAKQTSLCLKARFKAWSSLIKRKLAETRTPSHAMICRNTWCRWTQMHMSCNPGLSSVMWARHIKPEMLFPHLQIGFLRIPCDVCGAFSTGSGHRAAAVWFPSNGPNSVYPPEWTPLPRAHCILFSHISASCCFYWPSFCGPCFLLQLSTFWPMRQCVGLTSRQCLVTAALWPPSSHWQECQSHSNWACSHSLSSPSLCDVACIQPRTSKVPESNQYK